MDQEASSQRTYANLAPKKVMSKKKTSTKIFLARKSETVTIFHGFLPDFLSQGSMMIELQWDDS